MSPYVVIYEIATGIGRKIYRASIQEFLATGKYTLKKPADAKPGPDMRRSSLPSAGREATRLAVPEAFPGQGTTASPSVEAESPAQPEQQAEAASEEPVPPKREPRRRVAKDKAVDE